MKSRFKITELETIDIDGGYLIDGFPSVGYTGAVATESLIRTTHFELAGFLDSDEFPAVSLVNDGKPNFPTSIHVNRDLKVGVFSSYLALNETLHKPMAKTMLEWAKEHKVSYVISSVAAKSPESNGIMAAGSTDAARAKLEKSGMQVLKHGAVPGIAGALLNHGMISGQNVIVILFNLGQKTPDFRSSVELCTAMASLVPGVSCDVSALQKEAEKAEASMNDAKQEAKNLSDGMYR